MGANLQIARLALAGLSAVERTEMIRELTGQSAPQEPDRIIRIHPTAVRLGVTDRTVHNLLRSGALHRVFLPGRQRGAGVRESEIAALVAGKGVTP